MSDDEIRIAVAEACGWKRVIEKRGELWQGERADGRVNLIPDYPNDLNSCHEMEKTLTKVQKRRFGQLLQESVNGVAVGWISSFESQLESLADIAHATARQRCEAFLKTIGKWKAMT